MIMDCTLGVVGLGHWFSWLKSGVKEGSLNLKKAVGTRPYDDKKDLLSSFGIGKESYYIVNGNGRLPERFFEGLDIVHISDPNKFHAVQTKDSLQHDTCVVTEKTLAINKIQFDDAVSFIRKNCLENRFYLHLHYLHKQPTISLSRMLPELVSSNGKISSVDATFFEHESDEDARRAWLFDPENGGIFMDWIHPFEILFYSTGCEFGRIDSIKEFMVNERYDSVNPTGIEATLGLKGKNYTNDAAATIRVAKGVTNGYAMKRVRLRFESGNYSLLVFPGHEAEFNDASERGRFELVEPNGNGGNILASKSLHGPNSSEIFIKEVLDLCNGNNMGLGLDDISKIFKPQWDYQNMKERGSLIRERNSVTDFLQSGTI